MKTGRLQKNDENSGKLVLENKPKNNKPKQRTKQFTKQMNNYFSKIEDS